MNKSHFVGPLYVLCVFFFSQGAFGSTVAGCIIEPLTDCNGYDLSGAALSNANLEGAYLKDVVLQNANLSNANLKGAYLKGTSLMGANLSGTNLRGAYLKNVSLENADLTGANLEGAYFSGVLLGNADLTGATFNLNTAFPSGFDPVAAGANLVPIPAALWLFGSALAGLFGINRIRKQAV